MSVQGRFLWMDLILQCLPCREQVFGWLCYFSGGEKFCTKMGLQVFCMDGESW